MVCCSFLNLSVLPQSSPSGPYAIPPLAIRAIPRSHRKPARPAVEPIVQAAQHSRFHFVQGVFWHVRKKRVLRILHECKSAMILHVSESDDSIIEHSGKNHAGNARTITPRRAPEEWIDGRT